MVNAKERKERGSTLEKSMRVLEAVADQPQPVGLPDLTARLGLPRQTLHRILQQLEENSLIVRDPARDRYSIGPRLSRLALLALNSANQSAPVRPILQELVDEVKETCNIGVLDGLDFVYLERIECDWSLRIHLQAGSRMPAHCTSGGKVLLAFLPDEARERLLKTTKLKPFTENTITRVSDLEAALAQIRERGYALNNQEYSIGIVGIAVPILGPERQPLAALALHAPVVRVPFAEVEKFLPKLKAAGKRLARAWQLSEGGKVLAA